MQKSDEALVRNRRPCSYDSEDSDSVYVCMGVYMQNARCCYALQGNFKCMNNQPGGRDGFGVIFYSSTSAYFRQKIRAFPSRFRRHRLVAPYKRTYQSQSGVKETGFCFAIGFLDQVEIHFG